MVEAGHQSARPKRASGCCGLRRPLFRPVRDCSLRFLWFGFGATVHILLRRACLIKRRPTKQQQQQQQQKGPAHFFGQVDRPPTRIFSLLRRTQRVVKKKQQKNEAEGDLGSYLRIVLDDDGVLEEGARTRLRSVAVEAVLRVARGAARVDADVKVGRRPAQTRRQVHAVDVGEVALGEDDAVERPVELDEDLRCQMAATRQPSSTVVSQSTRVRKRSPS